MPRSLFVLALAWSAALLAVSVSAHEVGEEITPQIFAAVIDLRDERAETDGLYCPPDPNEEYLCFGNAILIQKGQIHRFIGARPRCQ